jgi:hypothetical protein
MFVHTSLDFVGNLSNQGDNPEKMPEKLTVTGILPSFFIFNNE